MWQRSEVNPMKQTPKSSRVSLNTLVPGLSLMSQQLPKMLQSWRCKKHSNIFKLFVLDLHI